MLIFEKKLPYAETTIATLGYWLTVVLTRGIIYWSLQYGKTPAVYFLNMHVHHFVTGFFLLVIVQILRHRHSSSKIIAAVLGISLGLVFDEFLYWTMFRFDYWSTANLIAIGVSGFILILLDLEVRHEQFTKRRHFTYRSSLGLVVPAVLALVMLGTLFAHYRRTFEDALIPATINASEQIPIHQK